MNPSTRPTMRRSAAQTVRGVLAQARLETRLLLRSSESLLITLGIPLGVLVFFSVVPVLPAGDRTAVQFLVPGVLGLSAAAVGLVASAIQTAYERKSGALKLLGSTPLGRSGFLAAKLASVWAILLVQTALVLAVATLALGWRPAAGLGSLPLAVGIVLLAGLALAALGLLVAGTLSAEVTTAVTNALFLGLMLLAGVAVAPEELPAAAATLGAASPLGAAVTALRAVLEGEGSALTGVLVLLAWGGAAALLGVRRFRWEP
jgi:ABC-2 type transport system permease protein